MTRTQYEGRLFINGNVRASRDFTLREFLTLSLQFAEAESGKTFPLLSALDPEGSPICQGETLFDACTNSKLMPMYGSLRCRT